MANWSDLELFEDVNRRLGKKIITISWADFSLLYRENSRLNPIKNRVMVVMTIFWFPKPIILAIQPLF